MGLAGGLATNGQVSSGGGGSGGGVFQNGVIASGDLLVGTISISSTTGALTFTPATAATPAWVANTAGTLVSTPFTAAAQTITPSLPASTQYAVVGVEIDTTGAISLVKGTDTATQLNTAILIASNSPATSSGKMRIADFAYWNNAGTINFGDHTTTATRGTNWIDRRPFARGFCYVSAILTAGNYTTTGVAVSIDSTRLLQRVECTGVPLRFRLTGMAAHSTDNGWIDFILHQDGSAVAGARSENASAGAGDGFGMALLDVTFTPTAGSHVLEPWWQTSGATATLDANSTYGLVLTIEELVRQNTSNGSA